MLPSSPRRPASAGPSGRDITTPKGGLDRELPRLPLLGAPIDLSSSANTKTTSTGDSSVRGSLLWDVIVERDAHGNVSEDADKVLSQLGRTLHSSAYAANNAGIELDTQGSSHTNHLSGPSHDVRKTPSKPVRIDKRRLASLVQELQDTESKYLKRLKCLKMSYADPLRTFAKRAETMIIPVYDAKVMFANLDSVVEAAERFSKDLQDVDISGRAKNRNIGDVCLLHLKELQTFDCYRSYYDKQDESQRSFRSMLKRPQFETFTESVKYQTSGIGNIGIRELLAEPVQRIPRYTLLWQGMVDCLGEHDSQRSKLLECIEIASKIAMCETDERTKRATVMYCLERTVDGFPANLISNNRDFIDCVDADDLLSHRSQLRPGLHLSASNPSFPNVAISPSARPTSPAANQSNANYLNCTLFLFSDKLVIANRSSSTVNGRKATGLDDLDKMMRGGGGLLGLAQSGAHLTKGKLSFRGIIDLLQVAATEHTGGDFRLHFAEEPSEQGDKWSGRSMRNYVVVHPPLPPDMDIAAARRDKRRFIRNLWTAQALMRTKPLPSAAKGSLQSSGIGLPQAYKANSELSFGSSDRPDYSMMLYTNVWNRTSWLASQPKARVVLQVDCAVGSEALPTIEQKDPPLVLRLESHRNGMCELSLQQGQQGKLRRDRDTCALAGAIERAIQMVHDIGGVLQPQTDGRTSQPTTPTSTRNRSSLMTLDTISRSLFGTQSMSSRSKSSVSRSSTLDTSRFSVDTRSTAATSFESHSLSAKPPIEASPGRSPGSARAKDVDLAAPHGLFAVNEVGSDSEVDLNARLNLAKVNSVSTNRIMSLASDGGATEIGTSVSRTTPPRGALHVRNWTPSPPEDDMEDLGAIKPINLPLSAPRPLNLARDRTPSPTKGMRPLPSLRPLLEERSFASQSVASLSISAPSASSSTGLSPGRLLGPRQPTVKRERSIAPVGSSKSGRVVSGTGRRVSAGRETTPLKDSPSPVEQSPTLQHKRARSDEAIAPRKRSFDRHTMPKGWEKEIGDREPVPRGLPHPPAVPVHVEASPPRMTLVEPTPMESEDVFWDPHSSGGDNSRTATTTARLLKVELDRLISAIGRDAANKQRQNLLVESSPGLIRSPPSRKLSTHVSIDADRPGSLSARRTPNTAGSSKVDIDAGFVQRWVTNAAELLEQITENLSRAESEKVRLQEEAETYHQQAISSSLEVNSLQGRLARATSKADLAKTQIRDLTAELETVYETFNVELDSLFNDMQLPPTEAFKALQRDVQETKAKRNDLHLENIRLRRELQESNMKRDELSRLLRAYGSG